MLQNIKLAALVIMPYLLITGGALLGDRLPDPTVWWIIATSFATTIICSTNIADVQKKYHELVYSWRWSKKGSKLMIVFFVGLAIGAIAIYISYRHDR